MTKNVDVLECFIDGGNYSKTKNLYIDGDKLIHYDTCIAERIWSNGEYKFKINVTKYSGTTSTIQNKLQYLVSGKFEPVGNVGIGTYNLP